MVWMLGTDNFNHHVNGFGLNFNSYPSFGARYDKVLPKILNKAILFKSSTRILTYFWASVALEVPKFGQVAQFFGVSNV